MKSGIIIVLTIVLIAGVAFWIGTQQTHDVQTPVTLIEGENTEVNSSYTDQNINEPFGLTAATNTDGLIAYTNTKYDYTFLHNYDVIFTPIGMGFDDEFSTSTHDAFNITPNDGGDPYYHDVSIFFSTQFSCDKVTGELPLSEWAHTIWQINKDEIATEDDKQVSDLTELSLGGKPAYHFALNGSYSDDCGGGLLDEPRDYILSEHKGTKFIIEFDVKNRDFAEQVLSTFRFEE